MTTNEMQCKEMVNGTTTKRPWRIRSSEIAKRCHNPIRSLVEGLKITPNPDKPMIALSIGDPTVFGNLRTAQEVIDAVTESIHSLKFNGYAPCIGYLDAREAIAKYISQSGERVEAKDVIICSGCSQALELAISVLASPGQNILIPRPGFPSYKMVADCIGVSCKSYDLLPEHNWQANLSQLESLVDKNTAAIIVNNPSNPCGSVYSKSHLNAILEIAARHCVPIISDEVYEKFVFNGKKFYSLGQLSKDVPILTCGGLAKRFLVPGWRQGWIIIHDRHNAFQPEIYQGLVALSQTTMGSNTLVQGSIPAILTKTPAAFFEDTLAAVEKNAKLAYEILSKAPGLSPIMPSGAMYMMVGFDLDKFPKFSNDLELVEQMVSEQSVFCLPGKAFDLSGYVRIVLTIPETQMEIACNRILEFCEAHFRPNETTYLEPLSFTERVLCFNGMEEIQTDCVHAKNGFQTNGNVDDIHEEKSELSKG